MEPRNFNCAECKRLVRLCSGLDFFPADPEVRMMLIERLHCLAASHEHARRMIDRWLERKTMAPKVSDLVGLAAEVSSRTETLPGPCDLCRPHAGNWQVVERRGEEFMSRCDCPRGKALQQADANRETEK